jgi:hypothetical protein
MTIYREPHQLYEGSSHALQPTTTLTMKTVITPATTYSNTGMRSVKSTTSSHYNGGRIVTTVILSFVTLLSQCLQHRR